MVREIGRGRGACAVLVGVAVLAAALHAANLLYLASTLGCDAPSLACPADVDPWGAPDTRGYLRVADSLRERGPLATSYLARLPGYPGLLAAIIAITGQPTPVLWIAPLLAAAAAAAIAWIALLLTESVAAALAAGLLFCAWPNAYQFSSQLLTDASHAFLAVAAFASSLRWRQAERPGAAWLAGALWVAAQSLRLTFFALFAILPLLLWKREASRHYLVGSIALWISTLVVPAFVIVSNHHHHGVLSPSLSAAANLACYATPRLRMGRDEGAFSRMRSRCLRRFEDKEPGPRIRAQMRYAFKTLGADPVATTRSFLHEIAAQTVFELRPHSREATRSLYPAWATTGSAVPLAFWICAIGGLIALARRDRALALFLVAAFWAVMLPAGTSHLVGARLRLPLDLFFLPLVPVFCQVVLSALRRRVGTPPLGAQDDQAGRGSGA